MTPEQFRAWRKARFKTQRKAAVALGLSVRTVEKYERGSRGDGRPFAGIPRHVALACSAIAMGLPPYGEPMPD